jgi:hypothetical protein
MDICQVLPKILKFVMFCQQYGVKSSFGKSMELYQVLPKNKVMPSFCQKSLERLVCYYAKLFASQGLLDIALEYFNLSPANNSSQEMQMLFNRISQSSQGIYYYKEMKGEISYE